jgi:DNA polymerase
MCSGEGAAASAGAAPAEKCHEACSASAPEGAVAVKAAKDLASSRGFLAQSALAQVEASIAGCHKCPLADTRTNIVFGTGNPCARVVLIGEAPGRNEDAGGEPFVGAAGKRLNALLARAGLAREEVYIANVVKCRPPSNRNPKPGEIEACSPYLRAQLAAIRPQVLVCLGNFATRFVLHTDKGITDVRGAFTQVGSFLVLPVFHPAAAIYDRSKQATLEADFDYLGAWLAAHPASEERA